MIVGYFEDEWHAIRSFTKPVAHFYCGKVGHVEPQPAARGDPIDCDGCKAALVTRDLKKPVGLTGPLAEIGDDDLL